MTRRKISMGLAARPELSGRVSCNSRFASAGSEKIDQKSAVNQPYSNFGIAGFGKIKSHPTNEALSSGRITDATQSRGTADLRSWRVLEFIHQEIAGADAQRHDGERGILTGIGCEA